VADDWVRVVIADDHVAALLVFSRMLQPEFDVVGTAKNGLEALVAVNQFHPDVVVLDIEMPVMGGLIAARRLRATDPAARIVFLTVYDDPDYVEAAFNLGASGYVLKSRAAIDLPHAIRLAMLGKQFVSPGAKPK